MNIRRFFLRKTPFNILRQKYDEREKMAEVAIRKRIEHNRTFIPAELKRLKQEVINSYNDNNESRAERYLTKISFLEEGKIRDLASAEIIARKDELRGASEQKVYRISDELYAEFASQITPTIDLNVERAKRNYYDKVEAEEAEYQEYVDSLSFEESIEEFNRKHCDYDNSGFEKYKRNKQEIEEFTPYQTV